MFDVFEKLAPCYGRVIRKFAIDVWYGRADVGALLKRANRFRRTYERDLGEYFRRLRLRFSPSHIHDLSEIWLSDQILVAGKIRDAVAVKKDRLLLEKMDEKRRTEIRAFIEIPADPEGRVSPVVSFQHNFAARALQIGEEQAFILGRDLNHAVVRANSPTYLWQSQEDARVRMTHRKLNGKIFNYNSPPTTIDRYGHVHTGNPGTDWGCRCWEVPTFGKPLVNYVARE